MVFMLSMALTPQQQRHFCDLLLHQQTAQPNHGSSLHGNVAVEAAVNLAVATAMSAWQRICNHASFVVGVALRPSRRGQQAFSCLQFQNTRCVEGSSQLGSVDSARALHTQLNNVAKGVQLSAVVMHAWGLSGTFGCHAVVLAQVHPTQVCLTLALV